MVEYDFYANTYLGSAIPEKAFSGVAARAAAVLARFKRIYRVNACGETSEKMALCAMAEVLYAADKRKDGLRSASVGSVSVSYGAQSGTETVARALYRSACTYLDISRGVQ